MENNTFAKHPTFYAVGLSYKKADAEMRGKFSLDDKAKQNLLHQAKEEGLESLLVTSTCNRTEIYGFAQHPFQLIKLLCENSQGTVEDFQKVAFVYKNNEAISQSISCKICAINSINRNKMKIKLLYYFLLCNFWHRVT